LAPATQLAEVGARIVEICGQHAHQQLQTRSAQRDALDRFAGVPVEPLREAQREYHQIGAAIAALGGDARMRARELDLLRFQLDELESANLIDANEDAALAREEDELAEAVAHQEAAAVVDNAVSADGGAIDLLRTALGALERRAPYEDPLRRLRSVVEELGDISGEIRLTAERIEPDPERLEAIRQRRHLLVELRRKYGETLEEVMEFQRAAQIRLEELESHDARASALQTDLEQAGEKVAARAEAVAAARAHAAPELAAKIAERLAPLALSAARFDVVVTGDPPADDVEFRLSTNPGMPTQPILKAASGGELSRTMLALHLVLSADTPTMVFDEVDAGLGGQAATAVGKALSELAVGRQVFVVTHLPQVAAFADAQLAVSKTTGDVTATSIMHLGAEDRVIELSRMLSGSPDSDTAQRHAQELLAAASHERASR
jgi:DNA repair protein RecN (Recombination protein N)